MAGLDPAIHPSHFFRASMDARVKPAHDHTSGLARHFLAKRCLRRCQPCDRRAVRRTRYVIKPGLVTESDRSRIAAMLATDSDLQIRPHLPTEPDAYPHQFADAVTIDRDEGIDGKDAARGISRKKAR